MKTAPGQQDLIDVPADAYDALRIQAEKYSPGELARVISLLLAAQNDMRWTTSPRLSLELALVRATIPETDPSPAGLVARLERLERLANLEAGSLVPPASAVHAAPPSPADDVEVPAPAEPIAVPEPAPVAETPGEPVPDDDVVIVGAAEPEPAAEAEPAPEPERLPTPEPSGPPTQMPVPHAADAGSVDVTMLRRSWPALIDHLGTSRQMILKAILESATVSALRRRDASSSRSRPTARSARRRSTSGRTTCARRCSDLFGISPGHHVRRPRGARAGRRGRGRRGRRRGGRPRRGRGAPPRPGDAGRHAGRPLGDAG